MPDLDAVEEEPDPEPGDGPHHGVEGVHDWSPGAQGGGECPPGGPASRRSLPTRRYHRHPPTTSTTASARRPANPSQRSARCTSAVMALICSVKKYVNPNISGTPNRAAPASAITNFQNGTRALPAVRNVAARSVSLRRATKSCESPE